MGHRCNSGDARGLQMDQVPEEKAKEIMQLDLQRCSNSAAKDFLK